MVVEIKVEYLYYTSKRITPVFFNDEDLFSMHFSRFREQIMLEVPHLRKMRNSLRMTIKEEDVEEVDVSEKFFALQLKGILEKGTRSIKLRVFEFDSPVITSVPQTCTNSSLAGKNDEPTRTLTARRSLQLPNSSASGKNEGPIVLPLQRYANKQKEAVNEIGKSLEMKRQELFELDNKIKMANEQNRGHLTACGNCHLKLGHTRKICTFSPCKSVFSCGILSKHNGDKTRRSHLEKEIKSLDGKLKKAGDDLDNANQASEKLRNSSSRKIEEIITKEMPDRYMSNGLRNWAQLHKDVAMLQRRLGGKLPSRENVKEIFDDLIGTATSTSTTSSVYKNKEKITDYRMSSQKRLLSDKYNIVFPTDKKTCTGMSLSMSDQEQMDFKLALELQQKEMEAPRCTKQSEILSNMAVSETTIETTTHSSWSEPNQDLQFQADAAAALLQLQRRSSPQHDGNNS